MENDPFKNKIEFNDESGMVYKKFSREKSTPTLVEWVMKMGLAKTRERANYVLIAVTVIAIILAIFFFGTTR